MFFCHAVRIAHGIIIVKGQDFCLCTQFSNILQSLQSRSFRHIHNSLVPKLTRRPCNSTAVIAIGRGNKRNLTQRSPDFRFTQPSKSSLVYRKAQLSTQIFCNGVASAQHLKGIQAKTLGFILHQQGPQSQTLRLLLQRNQRGRAVVLHSGMEAMGRRNSLISRQSQCLTLCILCRIHEIGKAVHRRHLSSPGITYPGD